MKRKLFFTLALLFTLFALTSCKKVEEEHHYLEVYSYESEDHELVVENESLEMHFDTATTQFYIKEKKNGRIWRSNPEDALEDPLAEKVQRDKLNSQIILTYMRSNGLTSEFNNYNDSIRNGTYTYELLDNGIKVNYSIGRIVREKILPKVLPESRMQFYLEKMERSEQRQLEQLYRIVDINNLSASENRDELLALYPMLEDERVFIMREATQEYMLERVESFFEKAGYTYEEFMEDKELYSGESDDNNPTFNISILYLLDGEDFVVSVPLQEIEYKENFPITDISTLCYFGAGGIEDDGFLLVPDGAGALINFNGRSTQNTFRSNLYGYDSALKRNILVDEPRSYFPVFGISNQSSFICVLEDGVAYASVEADVSRKFNSYNYAYGRFVLVHSEDMEIASRSDRAVKIFEKELPQGSLTQRYIFVDSPEYADMAIAYREYLMQKYPSLVKQNTTSTPVALEIVGAIDKVKPVLGVPTSVSEPLTTYNEATSLVDTLLRVGINNLSVKYNGWFNGGVKNSIPDSVKLVSKLGSKKDFENMVKYMSDNGLDLYLDADFMYVYKNGLFDSFWADRDAARYLSRENILLYTYSPIWFYMQDYTDPFYLAGPGYYLNAVDKYFSGIQKLGVNNISFRSIGKFLSANYSEKYFVSRQETLSLQQAKLKELRDNGAKVMINGGNDFAVPHADFIVDMELSARNYNIVNEEVPFYPIALHGLVSYAGEAINLAPNYEKNLLKSIESGAGLYFVFMNESSLTLTDTYYTRFYASDFSLWRESVAELFNRVDGDLSHTFNQFITGHKKLADNVYMTTYEDGTNVIVNYSPNRYVHNGKSIDAKDYLVERLGE